MASFFSWNLNDVMEAFIQQGHDINKFSQYSPYFTPLGYALDNKNLDVFKFLIRRKADINKQTQRNDNLTPLWKTMDIKDNEFLEILINNGVERTTKDGLSLLTYAIKFKNSRLFNCLIKNGEDVNGIDEHGVTPLIAAVRNRSTEMVKTLLDYGAEFSIQSALLQAIATENEEIVDLLLERGGAANFQSITGFTPLTKASNTGNLHLVAILIKKGADVNLLDSEGNSPLINSIKTVQLGLVQLLVENGANVQQADGHGNLPITEALNTKCFPIIKFLVENGANWSNICNKNGCSPLTQSVQQINFDMFKFFLDRKEDVNKPDNNQKTPFLLAIETGNIRFAKMLTERGALLNDDVIEKIKHLATTNDDWKFFVEELEAERRILEDKTDDNM